MTEITRDLLSMYWEAFDTLFAIAAILDLAIWAIVLVVATRRKRARS